MAPADTTPLPPGVSGLTHLGPSNPESSSVLGNAAPGLTAPAHTAPAHDAMPVSIDVHGNDNVQSSNVLEATGDAQEADATGVARSGVSAAHAVTIFGDGGGASAANVADAETQQHVSGPPQAQPQQHSSAQDAAQPVQPAVAADGGGGGGCGHAGRTEDGAGAEAHHCEGLEGSGGHDTSQEQLWKDVGVLLKETPITFEESTVDEEGAGTSAQQQNGPAPNAPPTENEGPAKAPRSRASTIVKYASTLWMMVGGGSSAGSTARSRQAQGTWVDGEEWIPEDCSDAPPTTHRSTSTIAAFTSPRTGGRLLHRVGEVGRQLRNNANMLWANAMKEPHERHGRERSSVDDDQWLGGQEPEEEGHSFTYTEKSMGSMWADDNDDEDVGTKHAAPFDPYSKDAMSRNAKLAETQPDLSRPSVGRRTLSERNALRRGSLGHARGRLERNVRDVLRGNSLFCLRPSNPFRIFCARVTSHRWFEAFIIGVVICSCVLLSFETLSLDPNSSRGKAVHNLDRAVTAIFTIEVIMKVIAFGLFFNGSRSYLRSGWNVVDAFVVAISLVVNAVEATYEGHHLMWLGALRALRGLRMLRAACKIPGVQVVVTALRRLLPDLTNVLAVGLLFYYIFSVLSVVLLKGTMHYCMEEGDTRVPLDPYYLVPSGQSIDKAWCQDSDPMFAPPRQINTSHYHSTLGVEVPAWNLSTIWTRDLRRFDNVVTGIWVLYQMALIENWSGTMIATMNTVDINQQPIRDANQYIGLLYVLFMIVGSLSIINLVVGVSINKFNEMKSENDGRSPLITPEQHHWLSVQQMLSSTTIEERHLPPENVVRRVAHTVTYNRFTEAFIVFVIVCNTIIMLFAHYNMSSQWEMAINYTNIIVTAIFVVEMLLKILAVGLPVYLRSGWNKLDIVVTSLSILNVLFEQLADDEAGSSTRFLPVLRTLRVARVFRLVKSAKGMRKLLNTLYWSIPATLNVALVLSMFIYLWIIVGMNLFGNLRLRDTEAGINRHANFAHFPAAMLTMLRILSSEEWNYVMEDAMQVSGGITRGSSVRGGLVRRSK
uniref:Ion transport domain-containing protein n=1 Tax=Dunaliella tertiolecta TaxID=3047 RepID=A0A7S3R2M3_DUNTE